MANRNVGTRYGLSRCRDRAPHMGQWLCRAVSTQHGAGLHGKYARRFADAVRQRDRTRRDAESVRPEESFAV